MVVERRRIVSPGPRERLELRAMLDAVTASSRESPDAIQLTMQTFAQQTQKIAADAKKFSADKAALHGTLVRTRTLEPVDFAA